MNLESKNFSFTQMLSYLHVLVFFNLYGQGFCEKKEPWRADSFMIRDNIVINKWPIEDNNVECYKIVFKYIKEYHKTKWTYSN